MKRLLLVEDHVLVRQSIRAFLESAAFEIVGEATTGTEAIEMAVRFQPDVVVMDLHLPEVNGIEATRRICRECKDVRVVALTAYNEPAYIRALQRAGAHGFVLKTADLSELLDTINNILKSRISLDEASISDSDEGSNYQLTNRELEVLTSAARGWTNKQIGTYLDISDRTVQVHLQTIYQKLNASSRTDAVSRGISLGLITPHDGVSI